MQAQPVTRRSKLTASTFALALLSIAQLAAAEPFPTRDQNPLLAGYGIPMPLPAHISSDDSWQWNANFNWASTAIVQTSSRESLIVDAETRELNLTVGHSLGDRWLIQLQLPYRYTGGGNLDSFIDSWHDFFNLPQGVRPDLPRDQFRIRYQRDGQTLIDTSTSKQGLGDVTVAAGYRWIETPMSDVSAWLTVDLPTGDADDFTGDGTTDVSLALAGEHRFAERWSVFAQGAGTYLGDSKVFSAHQRNVVLSGLAAVGVNVWRALELKLQLDAHTAIVDRSEMDYLNDAAILTMGGAWKFRSGWQLDMGVSEDIAVERSPDVVFVFGLHRARK
jgi:hypothetical protein